MSLFPFGWKNVTESFEDLSSLTRNSSIIKGSKYLGGIENKISKDFFLHKKFKYNTYIYIF